ncbi:MAG: hypothetical protein AAB553_06155 [Patescibacteria group bacterium]
METLNQAQFIILGSAVLILGGLALFIYSILKKEQDFQKKEATTFTKYNDILRKAEDQARQLLDSTSASSARLLEESRTTSEHIEVDLDRILQKIAQEHIQKLNTDTTNFEGAYNQRLEQFQQDFTVMSKQLLEHAEATMTKQIGEATTAITTRTSHSQSLLEQQMQALLAQVETEIQEHKKGRIAAIDSEVRQLVDKTYREVLKQSMPTSIDQKLILEGLAKAKAQGGITL